MTALDTRVDITDLEDAYVICRTIGHAWDNHPGGKPSGEFVLASRGVLMLRCTRCTTERYDYLNTQMAVFHRRYIHPDKYRAVRSQTTRPNLRGEMMRRSLLIHSYQKKKRGAA